MLGLLFKLFSRKEPAMKTEVAPVSETTVAVRPSPLAKGQKAVTNFLADGSPACTISPEGHTCYGGAFPSYALRNKDGERVDEIAFNKDPLDKGVKHWTLEALLTLAKDRLLGFQNGPTPTVHNDRAIEGIDIALKAMEDRVAERNAAGVRGTHEQITKANEAT